MKDSAADGVAKVKGNIITTVTPERKAEEEKAEQEDAQVDAAETPEPAVSTPLRQDTKVKPHCLIGAVPSEPLLILGTFWRIKLFLVGYSYSSHPDCRRNKTFFS